jgi:UDP-glucose 4-epimerase
VRTLLDQGIETRALSREAVPWLMAEQLEMDLAEASVEELRSACAGMDAIVHLAGENEVAARVRPAAALAATVVATEKLVEAAAGAGVGRLVYLSTVHVYGERMQPGAVLAEDLRPEPRAVYSISRLACEHVAAMLKAEGTRLVVLRLTNAVGAPEHPSVDRWTLVANDLCRQGATRGELELRSSGMQWRGFVPMRDACSIIAAAATARDSQLPSGTYNLGSGHPLTVRELAELIRDSFERHTGVRPPLRAPSAGQDRPAPYRVSVERLRHHGLSAASPLAAAVDETVSFCLEHRRELQ